MKKQKTGMSWTELAEAFTPRLPKADPPLMLDRVPQDYQRGSYERLVGQTNPIGQLGVAALGLTPPPLQAGEPFFTRIRCDIKLPQARTLTITPKGEGLLAKGPRWKVKSELPKPVTEQLLALLARAARDGVPPLRLLLTPLEEAPSEGSVTHRLCASTGAFQDQVGNLCAYLDWHPAGPDGRPLSSPAAAELILERMAELCLGALKVLCP